jgi:predicted naringenin-chalcone synthase
MPVYLSDFKVIKPEYCVQQEQALEWFVSRHLMAEQNRAGETKMDEERLQKIFQRYAVKPNKISQRYFELGEISGRPTHDDDLYQFNAARENGADHHERLKVYGEKTRAVFRAFYNLAPQESSPSQSPAPSQPPSHEQERRPDHLIHVTCTGYISPSAPQGVVSDSHWGHETNVTHAYHMGCYAAMPAVRMAKSLVLGEGQSAPNYAVDIAHTEICSLHLDPLSHTPEQMIVQTLFADGHIKYTASAGSGIVGKIDIERKRLKVHTMLERVLPNSAHDMSWAPTSWGLQMSLSRDVPIKIKENIAAFSQLLLDQAEMTSAQAREALFAIHPGGPKIIDSVQEELGLREDQIGESKKILLTRGNMSSATLPHVWNEILSNDYPIGQKIVSFAFGPGLTIFGAVFEVA